MKNRTMQKNISKTSKLTNL